MREMWYWSGRKSILAVLLIGLLVFSGCTAVGQGFTLEDATAAGMLLPFEELAGADFGSEFEVVEVIRQDLITNAQIPFWLNFPVRETLTFTATEGDLTLYARIGQAVQEGDVLARLAFDSTVELELAYFNANQRLRRFEESFTTERQRRLSAIAALRAEPSSSQTALEIQHLETGLQVFELTNQANREALQDEVGTWYQLLTGEYIIAPGDGMVIAIDGTGPQTSITIADCSVFFLRFVMERRPELRRQHYDLMGHGEIFTLHSAETYEDEYGEEHPYLQFDARVVTDIWASGERNLFIYSLRPVDKDGLLDVLNSLVEEFNEEFDGGYAHPLYILLQKDIVTDVEVVHAPNALTLHTRAIREEGSQNYVFIYNDGNPGKRFIQVDSARVGNYVSILTGLDEGTKVVIMP